MLKKLKREMLNIELKQYAYLHRLLAGGLTIAGRYVRRIGDVAIMPALRRDARSDEMWLAEKVRYQREIWQAFHANAVMVALPKREAAGAFLRFPEEMQKVADRGDRSIDVVANAATILAKFSELHPDWAPTAGSSTRSTIQ
ncbi:hypothetical protein [Muricoccus pecuniae]|uniref:Uncharacterized protein n=1 Tax=Muricoccus pecuniae TaxID=693023 RepID=A0A840Y4Y3_9PROT|nr:hypothetical protein [Roseomonas pecuniae]MBB5695795.1 hypothetical protein [Roseomonas pecuniae]